MVVRRDADDGPRAPDRHETGDRQIGHARDRVPGDDRAGGDIAAGLVLEEPGNGGAARDRDADRPLLARRRGENIAWVPDYRSLRSTAFGPRAAHNPARRRIGSRRRADPRRPACRTAARRASADEGEALGRPSSRRGRRRSRNRPRQAPLSPAALRSAQGAPGRRAIRPGLIDGMQRSVPASVATPEEPRGRHENIVVGQANHIGRPAAVHDAQSRSSV